VGEARTGFLRRDAAEWQGTAVAIKNLVPILQGWDVNPAEQQSQIRQRHQAGKIDQHWEPRIVKIHESRLPPKGWAFVESSPTDGSG